MLLFKTSMFQIRIYAISFTENFAPFCFLITATNNNKILVLIQMLWKLYSWKFQWNILILYTSQSWDLKKLQLKNKRAFVFLTEKLQWNIVIPSTS